MSEESIVDPLEFRNRILQLLQKPLVIRLSRWMMMQAGPVCFLDRYGLPNGLFLTYSFALQGLSYRK
jgi:hypothetical protein